MTIEAPELTVTVEKPGAWSRRLTITVPADRIAREKKDAVQRLSKRVKLPGFRQGRIPTAVMEKKFGPAIEQEAVEKVINDAYREAIESEGLQPISQASVENLNYEPGSDLSFNVELEVRPEIELERIGGFTVVREQTPVSDEQVDEVLQKLREENAVWRTKEEGTPVAGDMATVEITPLDDATEAEPSKPRQYQIVIGEGQALQAVEDAIITLKAGDAAEFEVDLPENAEEPNGPTKPHRMHIRLTELKTPEYAALDDEFAKGLGDFDSLAVLRERIAEDLSRETEKEAERGVRMQLVQQIIDANSFEVPQSMVRGYLDQMMPAREGADPEKLEELRMQMWPMAEVALKRSMVVDRVAEMEALRPTSAEMDARIDEMAERMGRPRREVIAQMHKGGQLDQLEQEITEEKVFDYLKSLSEIQ
ncbi:MAG TPA: trigger factor [Longimicrobiales bacterium]|nr:trigger factor [Longimicrobiales bacterium]